MVNKYNTWIHHSLGIELAVNGNGNIEMSEKDDKNGREYILVFSNTDTEEEIIQRIGTEIYSWIELMKMQIDLVNSFEEAEEKED